jgi:hypothetical protein
VELTVAADPAVAPVLREVAADWTDTAEPAIDGQCVGVEVIDATTAEAASVLATEAGSSIDVATPTPEPGALTETPAVWVPDSSYWIARMQAISRTLFTPDTRPLASSPIVLAATPPAADVLGAGPVPPTALAQLVGAELPLTVAEPRRDTAGLVGVAWLQTAMAPDAADLPAAVGLFRGLGDVPPDSRTLLGALGEGGVAAAPVSEQAVIAHNASQPPVAVTAVPVTEAPALDFPYAILASKPRNLQTAAGMFRAELVGADQVFAAHGFRATDGASRPGFRVGNGVTNAPVPVLPVGPAEQVSQVLRIWISSRSDARVLSLVNINASMLEPMAEGAPPRIAVFQATASEGIELFTPNSQLGVWEYADDWTEVVPVATLTDDQKGAVLNATAAMQTRLGNESAMFEVLLAGYREMKDGYDPTRSNTLLLWTDGGENLPDGLALEEALAELERLVDVTRPIRVILLGLGPNANMTQLEAIAEATGGGAYQLLDPEEIRLIFLQALLT